LIPQQIFIPWYLFGEMFYRVAVKTPLLLLVFLSISIDLIYDRCVWVAIDGNACIVEVEWVLILI